MSVKTKQSTPAHGTQEWAKKTINIMDGCSYDCKYCYAKGIAIRFKRKTPDNWNQSNLRKDVLEKKFKKIDGRIMFPSAHDITLENLESCKKVLTNLLIPGNEVLIVTKPEFRCIQNICEEFLEFKEQITFRFTIGSLNDEVLKFWEPSAPPFISRYLSLMYACIHGYNTSVSCEPYLDNKIIELIKMLHPFVTDSIWIGKANRLNAILGMNGHKDDLAQQMAMQLMQLYNSGYSQELYECYKDDPLIKWKDSLKKEFGLPLAKEAGLDT